jgi:hypothetical protein
MEPLRSTDSKHLVRGPLCAIVRSAENCADPVQLLAQFAWLALIEAHFDELFGHDAAAGYLPHWPDSLREVLLMWQPRC